LYENLKVAERAASVSLDLTNTGTRAGDEVVQVYVTPKNPPAYAPRRWLAAFTRVTLAPGERRAISVPIPPAALTLVDEQGARKPLSGAVELTVRGSGAMGAPSELGESYVLQ
jgi:beta-glucosidase